MLKKLVKYGNSTALILDRPILDLLNIPPGAVVKLRTDGKSLVITLYIPEPILGYDLLHEKSDAQSSPFLEERK
jgi:antitoxin component of MazEF toxin-antitoxin module